MKSERRFGMLRRVCAMAVAAVLTAGCLTACGSSKQDGPLTLDQIKENGKLTVATEAAYELAKRENVEMPITEAIYRAIKGEITAAQAVELLMGRDKKHEQG